MPSRNEGARVRARLQLETPVSDDATLLRALTATMPAQVEGAADLVRSMRAGDRY